MKRKLKTILLLLIVIGLAGLVGKAQNSIPLYDASFPMIQNLCYDEIHTERIKVPNELNVNTLTIDDKLKFKKKTYTQQHHEYIRASLYPIHDMVYVEHSNIFPKWYLAPDLIRIDETGIISFYEKYNAYLPGGWIGETIEETKLGYFSVDPISGKKYFKQDHSSLSQEAYNQEAQDILQYGYLSQRRFATPTTAMLQSFSQNGFTVSSSTSEIKVENSGLRISWYPDKQELLREKIDNGTVTTRIITKYTYYEVFGQYLKSKETEITPGKFDNSDCYDYVSETIFTNYSTQCAGAMALQQPASVLHPEEEYLRLYPNPANKELTVNIPLFEDKPWISIFSSNGGNMIKKEIEPSIFNTTIALDHLPPGIYFVQLIQGNKIYSEKFIKQ